MNQRNANRAAAPRPGKPDERRRTRRAGQAFGGGLYPPFGKRLFDIVCSALALAALSPVLAVVAVLTRILIGSPVLFKQVRPGRKDVSGMETLFTLYKFRSMTDKRDAAGKLLADEDRLTWFGGLLRKTSLDELPELWNILKGDMSVVGPRPLLVRDMVFMTEEQRKRHSVRPGLSGLAQINGRNDILWEDKLEFDLQYIRRIRFLSDIRIVLVTLLKVFRSDSITSEGMATAEDLGDYLLRNGKVTPEEYNGRQQDALRILGGKRA